MMGDGFDIQTLDEILASMGKPVLAKSSKPSKPPNDLKQIPAKSPKTKTIQSDTTKKADDKIDSDKSDHQTVPSEPSSKRPKKHFKSASPATPLDLAKIQNPALAQILKDTPHESLAINDRQTNYLRWLAFYYLSLREHSKKELKTKLLAKGCEPSAVDELLTEFEQKGYQSDLRAALMVVREAVRMGRGRRYIEQKLWQYGLDLPYDVNELTEMVGESVSDGTILEDEAEVDWLKLAVEARCKKYGDTIPKDAKEKARQLRFLQYRGFEMSVCFDALKKTLADFD